MNRRGIPAKPPGGFTLIEVLVSLVLIAVLSTLSYEALHFVSRARDISRDAYARLTGVELTVHQFAIDFGELNPRPVRDVVGTAYVPALLADTRTTDLVTLTRGGWLNTAGLPRSTQQRVTWRLQDGVLYRDHTTVLDSTLGTTPVHRQMLKDVTAVKLRFMDSGRNWQEVWPAPTSAPGVASQLGLRPRAVEVTLELKDLGTVVRLVEVPG